MSKINETREKIWNIIYSRSDEADAVVENLSQKCDIKPVTAKLLYNRGYRTPEEVRSLLNNETSILRDPFGIIDMDKAVERIHAAVEKNEKIVIYGDYDVDGVTSVSCLYLFLRAKGADVDYYIPTRDGEGYGLSCAVVEKFAAQGVNLIITVDTGITAYEEAALAARNGIDMVITDHHECRSVLPDAVAVVNPHRLDCKYPFKELAGVGVVFKLLCAYEIKESERAGEDKFNGIRRVFREYADLTAIGTIADVMPIIDENRVIVMYGLERINCTERKGLSALIEASVSGNARPVAQGAKEKPKKKINSSFIGFGIAPRINAAGRISNASKAVELFLTDSNEKAQDIARELCDINRQRQVEENRIAEQAYKTIEQEHDFENDRVIVLSDDNWQQGIVGIVASRVTEKYGLPSIFVSFDGATRGYPAADDIGKGSGRSIKGMNLVEALNYCSEYLVKYGGHELAAGLTIERDNIDAFKKKINEYARAHISEEMLNINMDADTEIEMNDVTLETANDVARLEPFGSANPVPAFVIRNVRVERMAAIGAGKHTRLTVSQDGRFITAMYFGTSPAKLDFCEGDYIDLLFNMDVNDYMNNKTVQMIVKDARTSESYTEQRKKDIYRYEYIKGGGEYDDPENVLPTREDFGTVYTTVRHEYRMGHDTLSEKTLLSLLRGDATGRGAVGYIKLKFILSVFRELNICGVEEIAPDVYKFEIYFSNKANLDKSYILKKLKSQCRREDN